MLVHWHKTLLKNHRAWQGTRGQLPGPLLQVGSCSNPDKKQELLLEEARELKIVTRIGLPIGLFKARFSCAKPEKRTLHRKMDPHIHLSLYQRFYFHRTSSMPLTSQRIAPIPGVSIARRPRTNASVRHITRANTQGETLGVPLGVRRLECESLFSQAAIPKHRSASWRPSSLAGPLLKP